MAIRNVTARDVPAARAFLERHAETSLFLLANLSAHGPRLGDHRNSGQLKILEEGGEIVAAWCLSRRGNLLVQAGGRADLGERILGSCDAEPMAIRGVLGEWRAAQSVWQLLLSRGGFRPTNESKEALYGLALADGAPAVPAPGVRGLGSGDFEAADALTLAFLAESRLPVQGDREIRRSQFAAQSSAGHCWGAFDGERLVSIAGLNAVYGTTGQVGGVYTPPEDRRKGWSRRAMRALMRDSRERLGLERLILFTGEDNEAARSLYESLGFVRIGDFALLFGEWLDAT